MDIDYSTIQITLDRLRSNRDRLDVFGARVHAFEVNPPLSEEDVSSFESRHRVRLPEDYRGFLLKIGNGGAGPYYGLFPLGEVEVIRGIQPWEEVQGFVGDLSLAFPHTSFWNDLTGEPGDEDDEPDGYEDRLREFEERYYSSALVNGAVPITHRGCALYQWLVVNGPERGHVWCDNRADRNGLVPLNANGCKRVTFIEWYLDWLNQVLEQLRGSV